MSLNLGLRGLVLARCTLSPGSLYLKFFFERTYDKLFCEVLRKTFGSIFSKDLNPGRLFWKRKRYLCAMPSPILPLVLIS